MRIGLIHANLIPMTDEQPSVMADARVLVEGNKITYIGTDDFPVVPDEVIDCQGGYLLPGLTDMHVHLRERPMNDYSALLKPILASGITQIRNMSGYCQVLDLREKLKRGEMEGSHLYTLSTYMEGHPLVTEEESVCIDYPEQADELVWMMKKAGYDGIKLYNAMTPEVFDAVVCASEKYGIKLVGHVPIATGAAHCLQSSMHCYEHVRAFPSDDLAAVAGQLHKFWDPTLVVERIDFSNAEQVEYLRRQALDSHINRELYQWWDDCKYNIEYLSRVDFRCVRTYEEYRSSVKVFADNGGIVVTGTDTGLALVAPGYAVYEELYELTLAGLTPYQALQATTISASRCLGTDSFRGTLEAGKEADMVLVRKNPLDDIQNIKTMQCVMFQGKWYDENARERMFLEAESYHLDPVWKEHGCK